MEVTSAVLLLVFLQFVMPAFYFLFFIKKYSSGFGYETSRDLSALIGLHEKYKPVAPRVCPTTNHTLLRGHSGMMGIATTGGRGI
jgi:hypothetical protein